MNARNGSTNCYLTITWELNKRIRIDTKHSFILFNPSLTLQVIVQKPLTWLFKVNGLNGRNLPSDLPTVRKGLVYLK